ncbi:cupin [Phyllobacterium brassicacearum]|uniref:Cupin n=2 Tax=Phyllobacterium brassicacearum TaxID=314235 RepID=A0A2P7BST0_9HYPH|nr:cupin [Phyllobacterium brassicacearum]
MLVSTRNGANQLCMFEQWVEPGTGAPTHLHPVEEILTVLSGDADIWLDKEHFMVAAGQSVIIPSGIRHGFRNAGSETLHIHAVLASADFQAWFDDSMSMVRRWTD